MTDNKYTCPRCGGEEREAVPADQVKREPILNLAAWIERRAKDVGPYADHIVHSVKHYEEHIEAQAARIERLEAALKPFAFFEPEDPEDTAQKAWEQIYQDRVRDWIDFDEIAEARAALKDGQS